MFPAVGPQLTVHTIVLGEISRGFHHGDFVDVDDVVGGFIPSQSEGQPSNSTKSVDRNACLSHDVRIDGLSPSTRSMYGAKVCCSTLGCNHRRLEEAVAFLFPSGSNQLDKIGCAIPTNRSCAFPRSTNLQWNGFGIYSWMEGADPIPHILRRNGSTNSKHQRKLSIILAYWTMSRGAISLAW